MLTGQPRDGDDPVSVAFDNVLIFVPLPAAGSMGLMLISIVAIHRRR